MERHWQRAESRRLAESGWARLEKAGNDLSAGFHLLVKMVLSALRSASSTSHLSALTSSMSIFAPGFALTRTALKARMALALTRSWTKTSLLAPAHDRAVSC